jgi:septal ring factor EnvC (AmiA/AmiB activator)
MGVSKHLPIFILSDILTHYIISFTFELPVKEESGMKLSTLSVAICLILMLLLALYMVACAPAISSSDIAALTAEFKEMNKKLDSIDANIAALKGDVATIKGDVAAIKSNVSTIMNDVTIIKGNISGSSSSSVTDLLKLIQR